MEVLKHSCRASAGPERLLQLEGAFLVFSIKAPKAWQGAIDVFLDTTSDFSDEIDTLDAHICFRPGEEDFVECRLDCGARAARTRVRQMDHGLSIAADQHGSCCAIAALLRLACLEREAERG